MSRTIDSSIVRLNKSLLDLAVLNSQGVALASAVSEDRGAIEAEVKSLGEFAGGVTQEADLYRDISNGLLARPVGLWYTYTTLAGGIEGDAPSLSAV